MIGDGVNDVLSLKKANLGIAMESGSQATRSVADVVLLGDSFASLPAAFQEGNRIRNGMNDILKLFLVRVLFVSLLIICTSIIFDIEAFPFTPTQSSIFVLLTVGIPVFGLALWAPSGTMPRGSVLKSLMHFVIPASITLALAGLAVFISYLRVRAGNVDFANLTVEQINEVLRGLLSYAQTALVTFTTFCGLLLIVFAQPPVKALVAGDKFSGDWRPTILAGVILLVYLLIANIEFLRKVFDLVELAAADYLILAAGAIAWGVLMLGIWRTKLLDRFVGVDLLGPDKEDWK
jgi:cation-transporting ATPase E